MNCFRTLFTLFTLFSFTGSIAQLAKLTTIGEQQYRLNISRPAVVVTPFSKAIRSTSMSDIIADNAGGYLKYLVLKGQHGSTKPGAYVHFMKLDRKLAIKSETELALLTEGSENMHPVSAFKQGNALHLITAGPDKNLTGFNLTYWQVDIEALSLVKKNIALTSLPFSKNKEYDFYSQEQKNGKGFMMTVLEEGGKKENSILHSLTFVKESSKTGLHHYDKKSRRWLFQAPEKCQEKVLLHSWVWLQNNWKKHYESRCRNNDSLILLKDRHSRK